MDRCPNHIGHLQASLKIWSNRSARPGGPGGGVNWQRSLLARSESSIVEPRTVSRSLAWWGRRGQAGIRGTANQ